MNRFKALKYSLRPFVEADIAAVVKLAIRSKFQFSAEHLLSWSKHDPTGINIAEMDTGEIVGVCATINHTDKISFSGAFIVDEKYRRMEIGQSLMVAGLEHFEHRNGGTNASKRMVDYFMKGGFKASETAWKIVEYEYLGELRSHVLSDKVPDGVEIRNLEDNNFESLLIYDRVLAGYDRKFILDPSRKEKNSKTLIAHKDGDCVGYGTVKRNIFDAALVGPLYANDPRVAEVMLRKLLESIPDAKGLAMATVSTNLAANEFIQRMGIPAHDTLTRVYTKENMVIDTSNIYAQFDLDLSPL